jgi:hypothetical protein
MLVPIRHISKTEHDQMSSAGPQQSEGNNSNSSPGTDRGLRNWPGFTTAAVVFLLIVLLGVGGAAIANWNQSATVAIAITAGAPPKPSATPTPNDPATTSPPATAPPTGPPSPAANILPNPSYTAVPAAWGANPVACSANGNSGSFTFSWTKDPAVGISYVVSFKLKSAAAYSTTETTSNSTFNRSLGNNPTDSGEYVLRIQAMLNGAVAGDAIYTTLLYTAKVAWSCSTGTVGQSPLSAFTVSTAAMAPRPNDNVLQVNWTAVSGATKYVVTVKSTTTASSYGAECAPTTLGVTLIFPPRVFDQQGIPALQGAYYGQYSLRILPMNGNQAGDPIYKTVSYQPTGTTVS